VLTIALFAAYAATAPLDAAHAAVLTVLAHAETTGCDQPQLRDAAASARIRRLGRIAGDEVILAAVEQPCMCGAHNCPYYAIRLTPGKPRELLTAFGFEAKLTRDASPLPAIVVRGHDSALVVDETVYAYRNGTYAQSAAYRVRGDDGSRKPDTVPVRFAAGASSAPLRGSAALGWFDAYTFDAAKGQRLTIGGVRSAAKLTATLFGPNGVQAVQLRPGVTQTLPATGTYHLHVENDSETAVPYALTLSIR
jgi:hypothetical protein